VAELKVNDVTVTLKIDTGAEVSAISKTTLRQLQIVQLPEIYMAQQCQAGK